MTTESSFADNVARRLVSEIQAAARNAANEEELRIEVEKRLEPALHELGVSVRGRYERRTVLGGREDAVYGRAVIEYERPGRFRREAGIRATEKQLRDYLNEEALRERGDREAALRRFIGIGLDGERIFFYRYRGSRPAPAESPLPGAQLLFPELAPITEGFSESALMTSPRRALASSFAICTPSATAR